MEGDEDSREVLNYCFWESPKPPCGKRRRDDDDAPLQKLLCEESCYCSGCGETTAEVKDKLLRLFFFFFFFNARSLAFTITDSRTFSFC